MSEKALRQVLEAIDSLAADEQVVLVKRLRSVLHPNAQHALSERERRRA